MQHRQLNHKEVRQKFAGEERSATPMVLVANNVKDSRNLGALFRLADAAGIRRIFTIGASDLNQVKIRRVARSKHRHIELNELEGIEALLDLQKEFELVAVEITSSSIPYTEYRPKRPLALILGNEKEGISPEVLEVIDQAVHIPMYGHGSSMNVSMAASIVVYGLLTQLGQKEASD